tara:strand:+ start:167 stop:355 length:189 start_codon:yes stop_codon:yes gene_type:complete
MKKSPIQTQIIKRMIYGVQYSTDHIMALHEITYASAQGALTKLTAKRKIKKEIVKGKAMYKR